MVERVAHQLGTGAAVELVLDVRAVGLAQGAGLQGLARERRVVLHRQHDDRRLRDLLAQARYGLQA